MRRHLLIAAIAAVSMSAAEAADNVELGPGARITITDEAYAGVLPGVPQVPASKEAVITTDGVAQPLQDAVWKVNRGEDLRDTMESWAKDAGWEVVWNLPGHDVYQLDGNNVYRGSFQQAVTKMVASMPAEIRIHVRLVSDNMPPMVYVEPFEERK